VLVGVILDDDPKPDLKHADEPETVDLSLVKLDEGFPSSKAAEPRFSNDRPKTELDAGCDEGFCAFRLGID
jgi:hypothetical protein